MISDKPLNKFTLQELEALPRERRGSHWHNSYRIQKAEFERIKIERTRQAALFLNMLTIIRDEGGSQETINDLLSEFKFSSC